MEPAGGDQESASGLGGRSRQYSYRLSINPKCSMYGIFTDICHHLPYNQPNVGNIPYMDPMLNLSMNVFLAVRAEGRQSYAFIESS